MVMSRPRPAAAHQRDGDVDLDRDRALVRRCQDGDGAAFAELYMEYHDRLHRFCLRRLPDRDDAEEVAQEAFLRAWRAMPTFAGDLRFYPWLTVIAKNLCTDALRRRARYGELADLDRHGARDASRVEMGECAMSSEEAVMASFDGQLAAEAMARLSERHRHVLALREQSGLTYQQIADVEGVEVSAVETLLWRARQALKREYAALSGTRVLGGFLVLGAGLGRLAQRAGRRAVRTAAAVRALRLRDLAAAGMVTAALAGVAATSGGRPAANPVPQSATLPARGLVAPAPPGPWSSESTPLGCALAGCGPATTPSGGPPAASPAAGISGPVPPVGRTGVGTASPVPPVVSTVAGQVPTVVSTVTEILQAVTSNLPGVPTLPGAPNLPGVPNLPGAVSGATNGLNNLVSGASSALQKL
jgi:RNA polymerase sigma-70 factor (ECF subfamily)